jgi:hypothetical protein
MNDALGLRPVRAALAALAAASMLSACGLREPASKGSAQGLIPAETPAESRGPDPRAAFESSGMLGGISSRPESAIDLVGARGLPEAGVSLALGATLSSAAVARRVADSSAVGGFVHELILASGTRALLPGPALALASSGERIAVSCADSGSPSRGWLICFKAEGEGERLVEAWKTAGSPIRRLLALPGGRIAASDEASGLRVIDASSGAQAWAQAFPAEVADIAYAPGLILAAQGSSLAAFDEASGAPAWSAALTAKARSLSAGNGTALVLAESGSLSAFSLADGAGIGAAPGPFDAAIRPIADGPRALVALNGGGAAEIEVKSGQTMRSWSWSGSAAFIAADRESLYAGISGREGRGILIAPRTGEAKTEVAGLGSPAFDSPLAVTGARGGLLLLLMDGSLVLVGKGREAGGAVSALDAALAPPPEAAAAIKAALGRFKPLDPAEAGRYLRFDAFAQGMPVETDFSFTAYRYESGSSARRAFEARPAKGGSIVAIYDSAGAELAASIDELGSVSSASALFEKGRVYWVAAGWTFQAEAERFRLYLR